MSQIWFFLPCNVAHVVMPLERGHYPMAFIIDIAKFRFSFFADVSNVGSYEDNGKTLTFKCKVEGYETQEISRLLDVKCECVTFCISQPHDSPKVVLLLDTRITHKHKDNVFSLLCMKRKGVRVRQNLFSLVSRAKGNSLSTRITHGTCWIRELKGCVLHEIQSRSHAHLGRKQRSTQGWHHSAKHGMIPLLKRIIYIVHISLDALSVSHASQRKRDEICLFCLSRCAMPFHVDSENLILNFFAETRSVSSFNSWIWWGEGVGLHQVHVQGGERAWQWECMAI